MADVVREGNNGAPRQAHPYPPTEIGPPPEMGPPPERGTGSAARSGGGTRPPPPKYPSGRGGLPAGGAVGPISEPPGVAVDTNSKAEPPPSYEEITRTAAPAYGDPDPALEEVKSREIENAIAGAETSREFGNTNPVVTNVSPDTERATPDAGESGEHESGRRPSATFALLIARQLQFLAMLSLIEYVVVEDSWLADFVIRLRY